MRLAQAANIFRPPTRSQELSLRIAKGQNFTKDPESPGGFEGTAGSRGALIDLVDEDAALRIGFEKAPDDRLSMRTCTGAIHDPGAGVDDEKRQILHIAKPPDQRRLACARRPDKERFVPQGNPAPIGLPPQPRQVGQSAECRRLRRSQVTGPDPLPFTFVFGRRGFIKEKFGFVHGAHFA
jgi:hypothetical protein